MNIWDYLIIITVASLLFLAIRLAKARKGKGGCCGDCANCPRKKD